MSASLSVCVCLCGCVVFACISSHLVLLCLLYVHAYIEHTSQLWSLTRRRLSTAAADVVRPKCQVVCTHTNIHTHCQQHTHTHGWQLEQFPFLCAAHKPSTLARERERESTARTRAGVFHFCVYVRTFLCEFMFLISAASDLCMHFSFDFHLR